MAEEENQSLKRNISLTSQKDLSSTFNTLVDGTHETPSSPEQSPKKLKPSIEEMAVLDTFKMLTQISGAELEKKIAMFAAFDENEHLGYGVSEEMVGFEGNDEALKNMQEIEEVGADMAKESSEKMEEFEEKIDTFAGFDENGHLGSRASDEVSEKMVKFEGNSEVLENMQEIEEVGADVAKESLEKIVECEGNTEVADVESSMELVKKNADLGVKDGVTDMVSKSRKKDEDLKRGDALTSLLMIEMIDDTVVLDFSGVGGGKKNGGRGVVKGSSSEVGGVTAGGSNGGKGKIKYSRKEMEKLKFRNNKGQKKFWREVYNGFAANVREEYDGLAGFRHQKQGASHQHNNAAPKRNYNGQGIMGESSSGNMSYDSELISSSDFTFEGANNGSDGNEIVEEWGEDEESDNEYESIQRPAFSVDGEPDFDSGPPEDGLEYLRRVRWEAAQIPKVKIAKLDKSKLKEQSVYMPSIPDIEKCPPHLAPVPQWEDEFIADFSELRLAISRLEDSNNAATVDSDLIIFGHPDNMKRPSKNPTSLELPAGSPTLFKVLDMDPVTRVAMLNRCIKKFESASNLTKDNCAWLFALCAVVEIPLDADTCASLRCLLRRCAKLRAGKDELDDEVIMLNVMATISGKFFKQLEN